MKKTLLAFAVVIIGAMMLSAFTSLKQSDVTESEYTLATNDGWKVFRENVPYCDGADKCMGTGTVYVNTDTYQVAFYISSSSKCGKMDMSEYRGKDGYNMRFWHCFLDKYCYVNIFVPNSAFN